MIERLHEIIDGVIDREGGYVDHAADRGGPTMYGITAAVAREAGYQGEMRSLPRDVAAKIYWEQYIERPGFDHLAPLSSRIAAEVIDTGVNMGPGTAGTFLQRVLNVLNAEGQHYPDVRVDGQCGPQTRGALRAYLERRGAEGERVMLKALNCLQGARYIDLAERSPSQEAFTFGWLAHRVSIEE